MCAVMPFSLSLRGKSRRRRPVLAPAPALPRFSCGRSRPRPPFPSGAGPPPERRGRPPPGGFRFQTPAPIPAQAARGSRYFRGNWHWYCHHIDDQRISQAAQVFGGIGTSLFSSSSSSSSSSDILIYALHANKVSAYFALSRAPFTGSPSRKHNTIGSKIKTRPNQNCFFLFITLLDTHLELFGRFQAP